MVLILYENLFGRLSSLASCYGFLRMVLYHSGAGVNNCSERAPQVASVAEKELGVAGQFCST